MISAPPGPSKHGSERAAQAKERYPVELSPLSGAEQAGGSFPMRLSALLLGVAVLVATPAIAQPRRAPAPASAQPQPVPTGTPMAVRATARSLGAICNENQGACIAYVTGAVDAYVGTSLVNFGR